ncbi:MAG: Excinuclease ABC C subunit domain protein [Parcubacteria group bacterium GW2011_GWA1_42_7]|nr:MAG: Excinuclease ABC C subunit domain protein [Parcubacteria group bacterium GW2011_GWB1_42_6]KKS70074.1 MAG: Excinuclease ABC C subunit domain protein [Parcubacteria group bacterium GW2011_GWA1_42_7]KKS92537.1 MAG: Excinuclease ABC C subunit domain protein [Parcubacteria group bacterium GW2011_GWC1_43_12]
MARQWPLKPSFAGPNPASPTLRRYAPQSFRLAYIMATKTLSSAERSALMTYKVYILKCADRSLYVGCTNNLERRLSEHNNSKWGAHYTKIRRPVVFKYSESFKTLVEARRREKEIKGWRREKKLNLINSIK